MRVLLPLLLLTLPLFARDPLAERIVPTDPAKYRQLTAVSSPWASIWVLMAYASSRSRSETGFLLQAYNAWIENPNTPQTGRIGKPAAAKSRINGQVIWGDLRKRNRSLRCARCRSPSPSAVSPGATAPAQNAPHWSLHPCSHHQGRPGASTDAWPFQRPRNRWQVLRQSSHRNGQPRPHPF